MVAWRQFDENEAHTLRENQELADAALGPEPELDSTQVWVWERYMRLRLSTSEETGIDVRDVEDPLLARVLLSMDRSYREGSAKATKARHERARAEPPPPQSLRRH